MSDHEQASAAAIDRALDLLKQPDAPGRTYKTDRDYATSTDFAIEDDLRSFLANLTSDVGFRGEERGHTGTTDPFWCLDPIDGTTNYSRGLPNYGVSLALISHGSPVHGEIALPAHNERYATRSGIAYRDTQPIHVSETSALREALVSIGDFATGPDSENKNRVRVATLARLAEKVARVRMLGSAATDFAWLAAGRLDAVVLHSNHIWDVAAGVALVQAAGAVVTHHDGSPYSFDGPNLVAATPRLHAAVLDMLHAHGG